MALWQLMNLGTWCTIYIYIYISIYLYIYISIYLYLYLYLYIYIYIKYQTLYIEFLVIWLALYSWYKSYILQFVQIWKLTKFFITENFPLKWLKTPVVENKIRYIFIQYLVFNKTIIPLPLVGYELMIATSAPCPLSKTSYPMRVHGIIVKYIYIVRMGSLA